MCLDFRKLGTSSLRHGVNLIRNKIGNRNGAQLFTRITDTANCRNLPARDILAQMRKMELIRERLRPFFANPQVNIHHIFKAQGPEIFTRSGEARPPDFVPIPFGSDTGAETSQEFVLRCLHEHEKSREMDDASHIGIGKLYFPFRSVFSTHVGC